MKNTIYFIILFIYSTCSAQNILFKENEKYSATSEWEFKCPLNTGIGNLMVQVAKYDKGGFLKLSIYSNGNWNYIGGNVYVFLEDGSVISCTDKKVRDEVNEMSVVLYNFTNDEMQKLQNSNIMKIRFIIKAKPGIYGSNTGNYTAENYISEAIFGESQIYQTADEILRLY